MIENETKKDASVSRISARTGLLTEFVEFLENSMPQMITALISLVGILSIIATLNINVFFACLSLLGLVVLIYTVTGKFNYKLNANYNNQLEEQVDVLTARDSTAIKSFYQELMKWNIKLSDLETMNYFVIWAGVIAVFIYTPITVIGAESIELRSRILGHNVCFRLCWQYCQLPSFHSTSNSIKRDIC